MNRYWELLQKRPEWIEQIEFHVGEKTMSAAEISENLKAENKLEIRDQKSMSEYVVPSQEQDAIAYSELCCAYLRMNYEVKAEFGSYGTRFYLFQGGSSLTDDYGEYFPAFLFLPPLNDNFTYLTHGQRFFRYTCNAEHRLSKFMVRHVKELNNRTPGIFQKMVRTLQEDSDKTLIENMNAQLSALQRLPGNPFGVTDSLYLTEGDLYT